MFGVVDDTTTTEFTNRACAVHCNSLPVVVDKAVVVVLKFPNIRLSDDRKYVRGSQASHSLVGSFAWVRQ